MPNGGARPGAGRPKGSGKGRPPGAIAKMNQEAREAAAKGGIMPLEYMLNVMRSPETDFERRDHMAQAAAPYLHPRLQTTVLQGDKAQPLVLEIVRFAEPKDKDGAKKS